MYSSSSRFIPIQWLFAQCASRSVTYEDTAVLLLLLCPLKKDFMIICPHVLYVMYIFFQHWLLVKLHKSIIIIMQPKRMAVTCAVINWVAVM